MYGRSADGKLDGTVIFMYLMLFAGVGLLWLLQKICIRRLWDKKLSVSLKFRDAYIYEGEESALVETVVNDKLLPVLALGVHFAMSRNLQFQNESVANSNVTDQTYRKDVFSFLFHQQVRRTLAFRGKRRGFYQIQSAEITGYDFFLDSIDSRTFAQHAQMYVFPAQVDVSRISVICNAVSGMVLSRNRLHPDPFEFSGIRGYTPADPMNHINWKASSRTGELMVNQFDSTTNVDVVILLDVSDPYILKNEDLQEESIRIVSSLAARLIQQKMPVRIIGNVAAPAENAESFCAYYPAGAGNIGNLNQQLACLDTGNVRFSGAALLQKELENGADERTYIFISKNQEEEIVNVIRQLASANRQILWVVPTRKGQGVPCLAVPYVKILPWEVSA